MLTSPGVDSIIEIIQRAASQRATAPRRDARVLFVLTPDRNVDRALMAAHECAHRLGAELHLLRVVHPCDAASRPRGLVHILRETQRVLSAARTARRRCDRLLPEALPTGRVCVRLGSLVDQAVRRSVELDTGLIVMGRGLTQLGPAATALARRAGRPVLVPTEEPASFSLALLPPGALDAEGAHDVAGS